MIHSARQSAPAAAPSVVAIVGATGTGKSDLAIELAQKLSESDVRAEIVNADAMQLYRGMDIGTAKVPESERRGVPHHLFDVWEVTREASVADYQAMARAIIQDIQSRAHFPSLWAAPVSMCRRSSTSLNFPEPNPEIRAHLEARLGKEGLAPFSELADKDPLAAAAIDPQNTRRVIRHSRSSRSPVNHLGRD